MKGLPLPRDASSGHHRPKPLRGESLGSLLAGCPSLVIGVFGLFALAGLPPVGMKEMVRRGMIRLGPGDPGWPTVTLKNAWWYVPEEIFWVQNCVGLTLAAAGILLTYRKSRPLMSIVGFSLNALAAVLGYVFTVIDPRDW
jgi:hypothetical protein